MKLNIYLLEFEIGHLKTPVQAANSKEDSIIQNLKFEARTHNEKHLTYDEYKELYPQLEKSNLPYSPYKSVLNYLQLIQNEKWYLNYSYNTTRYFTNFNVLFVLGLFFICLLIFFKRKYSDFIQNLVENSFNKTKEQDSETKKCPYCSEIILSTAKKCKHCHSKLNNFDFLKNIKFNKCLYYSLMGLIFLSIIINVKLFIHPIIIYSIYSLLTLFDPLIVLISLIFINVIFSNKNYKQKILGLIGLIILFMQTFAIYKTYVANMWDFGRLIGLILVGISFNACVMKIIKEKFKRGFVFFFLYFLFTIFASMLISCFYEPIKAIAS